MKSATRKTKHMTPSQLAAHTAKRAVTMAKVGIRQAIADNPWPHWHILSFTGREERESRGVVDLIAVRKYHGEPLRGTKRGDDAWPHLEACLSRLVALVSFAATSHAASPSVPSANRLFPALSTSAPATFFSGV